MNEIPNFTGNNPITVSASNHEGIGWLVNIIQYGGSIRFQHSMTPEQSRQLAALLIEMAEAL